MTAVPDPEYPTRTWGPDNTPEHLRVWDQPVVADPTIPGFMATDLDVPEVITIHDTNNKLLPSYERPLEAGLNAQVLYPILTAPTEPYSGEGCYSNDPGDASPQNQTPWTLTLRCPASSPNNSIAPLLELADLIHFGTITMGGPEGLETPSIPMGSITNGPNSPPSTKRYSVQNAQLPGTSGGRTLSVSLNTGTDTFVSPWSSTSPLPKETLSN